MGKTILIVDDKKIYRDSTSRFLKEAGYSTIKVANPDDAILKVRECESINLILTDQRMEPFMPGTELCEYIKSRYNIPIIIMSSSTRESVSKEFPTDRKLQPDDFIEKPLFESEVIEEHLFKNEVVGMIRKYLK